MCQRKSPLSHVIIGIVVAVFFTRESLAQENTDWKERFFAEAPKRWEDYLRFARSLQITVTSKVYDGTDRAIIRSVRTEYKQTKEASLLVVYRENGPKSEAEAEGTNPSYSFKLKRGSPNRGWIVTDLDDSNQSTTFYDGQRKLQEEHLQKNACDCLRIQKWWLPTLIQDPDFKITAISAQEIDGLSFVRFDFDYPKQKMDYLRKGGLRLKGGWMAFDPEHDWILREYEVHTGHPEEWFIRQSFQIRESTDRHPIITHQTYQLVYKGEKKFEIGENVESQWQVVERSDVPLEEFTLSAFGLPEPPGIQVERSSRLYLWIALGGIVCLGIAALIRWQIRRRRMAA